MNTVLTAGVSVQLNFTAVTHALNLCNWQGKDELIMQTVLLLFKMPIRVY